jgi:hypothetical protein
MNVLLLIPDGVSLRNFLLTPLPAQLAARGHAVDALVGPGLAAHVPADVAASLRTLEELGAYPESLVEAPLRRTLEYGHLRWCNTEGTRFNLAAPIPGRARSRALRGAARAASHLVAGHARVLWLVEQHDRLAARRSEVGVARALLERLGTDVVLCAHQRPLAVQPVVLAARSLGVATATFIFSWDNLTTKARIAAPFDHFLVWSQRMVEELVHFYPDIDPRRAWVVGTPQFEPYADPSLRWSRARFCAELGLDPARPVVCYSGGDEGTCPDDPHHLQVLATQVARGGVAGDPQLVLRPAPVDVSDRYRAVLAAHPEIVVARPAWRGGDAGWGSVAPTRRDLELLVNLTRHSAVNVNMASTMTLDFALADTPVVNLGFDVASPRPLARHYYRFEHYRPVVDLGAARVATDPAALARLVSTYLADPTLDRAGRAAFVDLELGRRPGASVPAIVEALERIRARPGGSGAPAGRTATPAPAPA